MFPNPGWLENTSHFRASSATTQVRPPSGDTMRLRIVALPLDATVAFATFVAL